MTGKLKEHKIAAVLADYAKSPMRVTEIAEKHGVSTPTVSAWVKNAKIKLRGKGRRKKTSPDARDLKVLNMVTGMHYRQAGLVMRTTKQNIGRIVKRWKSWQRPAQIPFAAGDILLWKGKKLCVVEAGLEFGLVRDAHGRYIRDFPWSVRGRPLAVKVGHDAKFGVKKRRS